MGSYSPIRSLQSGQKEVAFQTGSPVIVVSGKHSGKVGVVTDVNAMIVCVVEDVTLIEVKYYIVTKLDR